MNEQELVTQKTAGTPKTGGTPRQECVWPSLCRAMRRQGLDDRSLANRLDTHWRTVQTWRLGTYHPRPHHIVALSRVLEIPAPQLLEDSPALQKNLPG